MSNNRNIRTMEFEVTDVPMIIGALRIAANTALMCGKHDAQERLRQLRKAIEQYVPTEAGWFDEEDWCELGMALTGAETVHVSYDVPGWAKGGVNTWMREKHLRVQIGKLDWVSKDRFGNEPNGPAEALAAVLQEIAPIECAVLVVKAGEQSPSSVDTLAPSD